MSKVRLGVDERSVGSSIPCIDLVKVKIKGEEVYVTKEYLEELVSKGQFQKGMLVDKLIEPP